MHACKAHGLAIEPFMADVSLLDSDRGPVLKRPAELGAGPPCLAGLGAGAPYFELDR